MSSKNFLQFVRLSGLAWRCGMTAAGLVGRWTAVFPRVGPSLAASVVARRGVGAAAFDGPRGALPLVVAALLMSLASIPRPVAAQSTAAKPALSVQVVTPKRADLPIRVTAHGSIAAWQEASVGAEGGPWRLSEVRAQIGDRVRKGQVLAAFDAGLVQADLALARAGVAEAEAVLAEMTAKANRARELQPTGVLSAEQVQQSLTAERTAQARLQAQQAAFRLQELRSRQTEVMAPDEGVIASRSATVGAVVPPGQELFRLIRQGRLEWRAEVASADLPRIRAGQTVQLVPAGAAAVTGRVRMVGPTVDAATRNGIVYVDLLGAGEARPGMFARGEFLLGSSGALTLPPSAVMLRDGLAYVFVVDAQSRVREVKVTTGRRLGELVEITGGLAEGARVVASGGGFLADGDAVKVVGASAPTR